jgi:hypothetical protein
MKRITSILVAALMALAFAGEVVAQTQTPPPSAPSGPGVTAQKPATPSGKKKAKRAAKRKAKRAAKRTSAPKAQ